MGATNLPSDEAYRRAVLALASPQQLAAAERRAGGDPRLETFVNLMEGQTPAQLLSMGAGAPGRIGSLYQSIAGGARPTDRSVNASLYGVMDNATPEEQAWIAANPQWMLLNGQLEGAGAIRDTGGSWLGAIANKVLQPLTKAAVGGAIGLGGLGALGVGPLAGGTWQGFGGGLAGSEGAGTLAGGSPDALTGMSGLTGNAAMDAALGPLGDFTANAGALAGGGVSLPSLGLAGLLPAGWGAAGPTAAAAAEGASVLDKLAGLPGRALDKALDNPLGTVATLGGVAALAGGRGGSVDTGYSDAAGGIASDLYRDTGPVRSAYLTQVGSDLNRYADPASVYASPAYGAAKYFSERSYNQARNATMGSVPRGGVLQSKLADLDTARAGSMTGTLADLWDRQRELSLQRASTAALGTPSTSIAGLTQAGQVSALAQGQEMQRDAALGAGLGNLAGQVAKAAWMRPNK